MCKVLTISNDDLVLIKSCTEKLHKIITNLKIKLFHEIEIKKRHLTHNNTFVKSMIIM
jgi:hypothetical protein